MRVGVGLKALEVRLQPFEIEDRSRRLDLIERPPDLSLEQLQRPICARAHGGGCYHLASEHRGHPEAVHVDRVAWRNWPITTSRRNSGTARKVAVTRLCSAREPHFD
jgi:hypothetical protein